METPSLVRLERVARNLPIWPGTLHMGKVETQWGTVYLAIGRGNGHTFPPVAWHGVYGFDYGGQKGMGRIGEIAGNLSLREAQQHFLDDACWFLQAMHERQMHDSSFKLNGHG